MTRHEFFVKRLKEFGAYDSDSDYGGMIGKSVEELSLVYEKQGHSGMSAEITHALWNQLMKEWEAKNVEILFSELGFYNGEE